MDGVSVNAGTAMRFPASKLKLDELFCTWLAQGDSQRLVLSLVEDASSGGTLQGPATSPSTSPLSPSSTNALFQAATTPPLSPQKGGSPPRSPVSPTKRSSTGPIPAPKKRAADVIPRFYFPGGQQGEVLSTEVSAKVDALFANHPMGMGLAPFVSVCREVCELPSFLSGVLFARIDTDQKGAVAKEQFLAYWEDHLARVEGNARVFEVLRQPGASALVQSDFMPVMRAILDTHPGLEFLKNSPEFQERYAETVIYRIFYAINRSGSGRITLRELKRSDLLEAMQLVDEEEDINKVLKYFSYEHFYVIYCKFWELDTDHDFLIDREDLLRYGNHALTYRIVDRVYSQAPRRFLSGIEGKMGYEDFCWFILSEEDKNNPIALEYWFRCVDLDCDGVIRPSEVQYFYEEQLQRMECLSQEPVLFEDILCQMSDMISPEVQGRITLRDLKRCKLSGNFFNVLFNLNKFLAFEMRDPFTIRAEREEPHLTEWDRFTRTEYARLSMEEEADEGEEWDDTMPLDSASF